MLTETELDQPYISGYKQLLQEILDGKIWQSVKICLSKFYKQ